MIKKFIKKWLLVRALKRDRNRYSFWRLIISKRESSRIFNKLISQCIELEMDGIIAAFRFFKFVDTTSSNKKVGATIKISGIINGCEIKIKTTYVNEDNIKTQCIVWKGDKLLLSVYINGIDFFYKLKRYNVWQHLNHS